MNWQRLDRDMSLKTIDSVKSAVDPGLFMPATCEVSRAALTFYRGIELYKIINFAALPSFTFEYLGDGSFYQYLDGTEQPIHAINDKGALDLNETSVTDYLEFYFSHVTDEDEELFLIRDPRSVPVLDSLGAESLAVVIQNHRPPVVSYDSGYDRFTAEADFYADGMVIRAGITVGANGRVTVQNRKMVVNAIAHSGRSGIMAL